MIFLAGWHGIARFTVQRAMGRPGKSRGCSGTGTAKMLSPAGTDARNCAEQRFRCQCFCF
jgi:hypothetical protein